MTTKEILAIIDEKLAEPSYDNENGNYNYDARDLWDILTALRGPDHLSESIKCRTTARVRSAALPLTAESSWAGVTGAIFASPDEMNLNDARAVVDAAKKDNDTIGRFHFYHHIDRALNALDRLADYSKP